MTTGCNIFKDKTSMPEVESTEIATPARTRMATSSPAGALATYRTEPQNMHVVNVDRPRRGHDY